MDYPPIVDCLECSCLITGDGKKYPINIYKCDTHINMEDGEFLENMAQIESEILAKMIVGLEANCLALELELLLLKRFGLTL